MKKAIVIILILIAVGVGIAYYMTQMRGQKPALPETTDAALAAAQAPELLSYVPDTTALCVVFSSIAELKTAIENSAYFKKLSSTTIWQTFVSVASAKFEQALTNRELQAGIKVEPPDPKLLWDLVGDEVAVTFLPGQEPDAWAFAFLARVRNPQRLKNLATLITDSAKNEGFAFSDIDYGGELIRKAVKAPNKGEFCLCQTHGLLTGSTDLEAIKSIIDLISSDAKNSLASSAGYRAVASKLRADHFGEFFMKLGVDMASVFTSVVSLDGLPMQTKTQGLPKMAGESLTRLYLKDGVQFESYTALDVEKSDPKIVSLYRFKPNDLPLLSLAPQGSTVTFALNCLDAKVMYDIMLDSVMAQNPMAAVMVSGFTTELEKKIGVSIADDLMPAVGPDVLFYYKGLSFKQALWLPELGFACSSSNPEKLYNAFPKIGDHLLSFAEDKAPEAKHVEDLYKGNTVHEIRLTMPIGEMSLAAAVVDKYFCVGFGREQVNMMIDCLAGEHPQLKDQPEYRSISAGFPRESNQIAYSDCEALWRQIRSALQLYAQIGGSAESKEALEFVDILLMPLKTTFSTVIHEHPSESIAVQRSYGHVKIEAE